MPTLPVVLGGDIVMAVLGAVFAPTVAAITVGLVTQAALAARLGRNAACDRAGNIFEAAAAGFAGWAFTIEAVFYLIPLFAALTTLAVLSIPAAAIDHDRARGLPAAGPTDPAEHRHAASWRTLLRHRPFVVLAAALALFHFANAPILLLLGQELAL